MDTENIFLILKSLHIISVIAWLSGLLYLPRLFVYHAQSNKNSELDATFKIMEKKLLNYITTPAMIATLLLGLGLAHFIGLNFTWLHIKIALVILMIAFHWFLASCCKDFAYGQNKHSAKFYRLINEVPILILIPIIFMVIFKPYA